ncbi:MAG: ExbD/TolR family protein [Burkholderiales bacterium]|nr:ExbD/TolR family protein [Burkholderiales bacterium]
MRRARKSINQINVVPYIDVMLVLLIIFMVTAPLINPGTIDLPSVGKPLSQPPSPPLEITVKADRSLWLRDLAVAGDPPKRITQNELVARIRDKLQRAPDQGVVIAADKSARYEEVINLIDLLQQNRIAKVGLLAKSAGQ